MPGLEAAHIGEPVDRLLNLSYSHQRPYSDLACFPLTREQAVVILEWDRVDANRASVGALLFPLDVAYGVTE